MKKIVLIIIATLFLTSCEIDDDGPRIAYEYAKVINADLPENLVEGKLYDINVTYLLPSACHVAAGIEVRRGGIAGEDRRKIYVAGVSSYDTNLASCDAEEDEETMTKEGTFQITIDEDKPYTFYLWTGTNSDGQNEYTTVEIPVTDGPPAGENT